MLGALPADQEQFMMIEDLYKSVDRLQKAIEDGMHNKVNIEFLSKQMNKVLQDIEDKYKKKTSWLSKKEWDVPALNNVMRTIWAQSGLDQSRKLGWEDTAAMMRKYLLTKGLLSTRGAKDDPKVDFKTDDFDLSYSLEPLHAKIGKGSWNEFYDLGLEKLGGRFDYKPKDEIEFKPYGADKDKVVEIIEYQGG